MGVLTSFKLQMANRVVLVDILAGLFGMGAWLAVNGMYTQLPLLVQAAPEKWNLPSYIVILVQLANIGAILYGLMQRLCPGKISDGLFIYLLMTIGSVALLLMAFFYPYNTVIFGTEHSSALLALVFACALVACTSSVLFIPYMSRFRETYLVSYMIGEGLSAFIPSITSLIQGVGGNPQCVHVNASDPNSPLQPYSPPPNFSVTTFLIFICCLQVISCVSFFLLKTLSKCKKERDVRTGMRSSSGIGEKKAGEGVRTLIKNGGVMEQNGPGADNDTEGNNVYHLDSGSQRQSFTETQNLDCRTYTAFLIIQAIVSMFSNGLFPAIQSYSCLPYGNVAYHLAINLGSMANPLACYIVFFVPYKSLKLILGLTTAGFSVAVYIFVAATMSPSPPFVGTHLGSAIVVVVWILFTGLISYVKLAIATRFRISGGKGLFWYGAMTQVGSATGAIIGFSLINFTSLFTSYSPCDS